MNLIKKWWFWVALYILIGLIVYRGYYILFKFILSEGATLFHFDFFAFIYIVFGWPFFLFAQNLIFGGMF